MANTTPQPPTAPTQGTGTAEDWQSVDEDTFSVVSLALSEGEEPIIISRPHSPILPASQEPESNKLLPEPSTYPSKCQEPKTPPVKDDLAPSRAVTQADPCPSIDKTEVPYQTPKADGAIIHSVCATGPEAPSSSPPSESDARLNRHYAWDTLRYSGSDSQALEIFLLSIQSLEQSILQTRYALAQVHDSVAPELGELCQSLSVLVLQLKSIITGYAPYLQDSIPSVLGRPRSRDPVPSSDPLTAPLDPSILEWIIEAEGKVLLAQSAVQQWPCESGQQKLTNCTNDILECQAKLAEFLPILKEWVLSLFYIYNLAIVSSLT